MSLGEAPTEFERTALPLLPDCFAFAVSLARNVSDAEDLVQETFLRAQRAFASFEQGTNAKAWLFTILRRVHIDAHRRAKIRPGYQSDEELDAAGATEDPDPSPVEYEGVTAQDVLAALERVPEAFRVAVRLRDLDGFTYKEIGEILDVPPGTVMSRIHRGRESLRSLLVPPAGGRIPPAPPKST